MPGFTLVSTDLGSYQAFDEARQACKKSLLRSKGLETLGYKVNAGGRAVEVCYTCDDDCSWNHYPDRCHSFVVTFQDGRWTVKSWTLRPYEEVIKKRRLDKNFVGRTSYVDPAFLLNKESTLPESQIAFLVAGAVNAANDTLVKGEGKVTCVVMLAKDHEEFWDTIKSTTMRPMVESASQRVKGRRQRCLDTVQNCKSAFGTIIFFLRDYTNNPPEFGADSSGDDENIKLPPNVENCRDALHKVLMANGFGAHNHSFSSGALEEAVASRWPIPSDWKIFTQTVFGGRARGHPEFTSHPLEQTRVEDVFVFANR